MSVKIYTASGLEPISGSVSNCEIDDTKTALNTTWSSDKLSGKLDAKQDKSDNTLTTTSKDVVGAINEVNSNLSDINTNLSKQKVYSFGIGDYTIPTNGYVPIGFNLISSDIDWYRSIVQLENWNTLNGDITLFQTSESLYLYSFNGTTVSDLRIRVLVI